MDGHGPFIKGREKYYVAAVITGAVFCIVSVLIMLMISYIASREDAGSASSVIVLIPIAIIYGVLFGIIFFRKCGDFVFCELFSLFGDAIVIFAAYKLGIFNGTLIAVSIFGALGAAAVSMISGGVYGFFEKKRALADKDAENGKKRTD